MFEVKSLLHFSTTPLFFGLLLVSCGQSKAPVVAEEKIWREFSGEKALAHVQQLVDFGPRPPASPGIEKSRGYIDAELKRAGWTVEHQEFTDSTPEGQIRFVNVIARWPASGKSAGPSFLLFSHYDTKTFYNQAFVGANDGGSSTGLLLEMARVLGQHPGLAAKVELVFLDGEEAYESFTDTDGLYGSRYFAKQIEKTARQFHGGMLFDMVGDRSLNITLPPDSPAEMARDIFASAEALKFRSYFSYFGFEITDDHKPLNAIGIPTIDLIDFNFTAWHTPEDTMDKISGESLAIVGKVAAYYLEEFALK